ncbi:MAG: OmpA family protein [Planctomycetes bacterium]|nr:OmpA family protein [Planctomycetota bacterium]
MRRRSTPSILLLAGLLAAGCNQNPYLPAEPPPAGIGQTPPPAAALAQFEDLSVRAGSLDADNGDLMVQLAKMEQERQILQDQVRLLQKQLTDSATQLREERLARAETGKQVEALEASVRRRGGATITANTSHQDVLPMVEAAGLEMRKDGDIVRIELPADQLFAPGTAQFHQGAYALIDRAASVLTQHYPQQVIVVEGHTSTAPIPGGRYSNHELSTAQATAVFNQLTQRNRLPAEQLKILGHGPSQPLASNASTAGQAKNRRVELATYPETIAP